MKRFLLLALLLVAANALMAQPCYWVFLTDKQGSTFDPYSYFDSKAIERYQQCGADLYDVSNYPVSEGYAAGVGALATETVGCSRWMNAIGVVATPAQAAAIAELPYVLRVQPIEAGGMTTAQEEDYTGLVDKATVDGPLEAQLVRMKGKAFRQKGINGKGIRIAVFDGGFPRVNTHDAFKHLRDSNRIVKTWNFPNKKEDVYGWNSHGTMTLSCIGGRIEGKDLGLATGAEYLLARTEVETEPFKEEVWWQMAVEWADKNGANIISSSLGYGKERYYTRDMDGTSYVAKAGNMAARKGMLVVNSAGNEADENQWKTIITPSDADSVLCVGGIENSLREYNHISFSSYGPSADGKLKPNVCAFGYARTAAVGSDKATHYVHGTSFSCPLVAGFAACAWQAWPGRSAMQMFRAIEQSGDLYPYYDYAFGYGVPQASHFVGENAIGNSNTKNTATGKETTSATPQNAFGISAAPKTDTQLNRLRVDPDRAAARNATFRFVEDSSVVKVYPVRTVFHKPIFYKEQRPDGSIVRYGKKTLTVFDSLTCICFTLDKGNALVVHLDGYTASYTPSKTGTKKANSHVDNLGGWAVTHVEKGGTMGDAVSTEYRSEAMLVPSNWGSNAKWRYDVYVLIGDMIKVTGDEQTIKPWSPAAHVGFRLMRAVAKPYCIGLGVDYSTTTFNLDATKSNRLDGLLGVSQTSVDKKRYNFSELGVELFQRVRFVAGGALSGKGLHWDLGVYASYGWYDYMVDYKTYGNYAEEASLKIDNPKYLDNYRVNWGVTTRLTYDVIGIYARYRLTHFATSYDVDTTNPASFKLDLPRLEVGIQLTL